MQGCEEVAFAAITVSVAANEAGSDHRDLLTPEEEPQQTPAALITSAANTDPIKNLFAHG